MSFGPLEKALQLLDEAAWQHVMNECLRFVAPKGRDWTPLFNLLYEAFGYEWLTKNGYTRITFIERSDKKAKKTPELLGKSQTSSALLEVKTINTSKKANERRKKWPSECFKLGEPLPDGFERKFTIDVEYARKQLLSYDEPVDRRIILVVIMPDIEFWLDQAVNREIDELAASLSTSGFEVIPYQLVR